MKKLNICIAGLGNVGSSVVNLIEENSSYVEKKSNLNLNIIGLSAKNINKERSFDTKKYKWAESPIDLLNINHTKPDILIELIGYEKGVSYDLVKSALSKKIHVITSCFKHAASQATKEVDRNVAANRFADSADTLLRSALSQNKAYLTTVLRCKQDASKQESSTQARSMAWAARRPHSLAMSRS